MRNKEARAGSAGQGEGRRRADARLGRERGPAIPGPLNVSHDFLGAALGLKQIVFPLGDLRGFHSRPRGNPLQFAGGGEIVKK